MTLVVETSLAATVDRVNAALFGSEQLSTAQRVQAARFIAQRQGQSGCYHGLFAPLPGEPAKGLTLFTGEKITTWAGSAHILGQEALHALLALDAGGREAQAAADRAQAAMTPRLAELQNSQRGMYCCGKCSLAVWRVIAAGGYGGDERFISRGLGSLAQLRDAAGRWRVFPFWYSVLALSEIKGPAAQAELRYCAGVLERSLKRSAADETYSQRRRRLAQRALARI
jgi:hypothetical protein